MKPIDPNIFDREVTCTYRGETYHICGVNKTSILQSHRGQKNNPSIEYLLDRHTA